MESHILLLFIRTGMCNLCYAFCNSPRPRCSVLELVFSKAEIRSFSKTNGRLSATWNTRLFDFEVAVNNRLQYPSSRFDFEQHFLIDDHPMRCRNSCSPVED